jgi:hypothetical protein
MAVALASTPSAMAITIQNFFSVRIHPPLHKPVLRIVGAPQSIWARREKTVQTARGAVDEQCGSELKTARTRGAVAVLNVSVRFMATSSFHRQRQ